MFVLGLTGSIGMGKTTTAEFFAQAGVPVYDADKAVHELYEGEAAPLIEAAFPGTTRDGKVDREALAARVLNNPDALRKLESIVHPLVRAVECRFLDQAQASGAPVVVLDIPLLFETRGEKETDAVVVVSAPAEVQQVRAMQRPGMTEQKLEAILRQQMPDAEKRRRADFLVDTSQGFAAARAQVHAILDAVATMPKRRP
ncbi:MAG: dephospho-CoA kinase [Xanthobacteraceae bacterium]